MRHHDRGLGALLILELTAASAKIQNLEHATTTAEWDKLCPMDLLVSGADYDLPAESGGVLGGLSARSGTALEVRTSGGTTQR